jgi:hypothetical protein
MHNEAPASTPLITDVVTLLPPIRNVFRPLDSGAAIEGELPHVNTVVKCQTTPRCKTFPKLTKNGVCCEAARGSQTAIAPADALVPWRAEGRTKEGASEHREES